MLRRDFLQSSLGAAAATLVGCDGCNGAQSTRPGSPRKVSTNTSRAAPEPELDPPARADLAFVLRAGPGSVSLFDGSPTKVLRFSSRLLRGAEEALVADESSYLGPTVRVERGQRVHVQLENGLEESTIVHWHGLDVAEKNDGHPSRAIGPGGRYLYDFEIHNRAGLYWYHPHPHHRTGPQVYRGLAGLLIVSDDEERRLGLPDGDRELTLVIQDRTFDGDHQLVYAHHPMLGFLGEQVLVNGRLPRTREIRSGAHRLRILNGSNSRIYDLAWSDGSPLTVLGTDGGLLDAPLERSHVVLAPGQRLDVWASFGTRPGPDVWLESRAFGPIGSMMGMGRGMMGRGMMRGGVSGLENGAPLRIQHFVSSGGASEARPPEQLAPHPAPSASQVVTATPKTFTTSMRMMRWLLNGRSFEMRGVAPNERVRLGTVEEWEFVNATGPMTMAHPMHLHGSPFRIVERRPGPGSQELREGLIDEAWLDTFLLLPGDRVRIRVGFHRYEGMFLYHCHNLEHEDMGMMRNYLVESS